VVIAMNEMRDPDPTNISSGWKRLGISHREVLMIPKS
jgi:hypothetical protein